MKKSIVVLLLVAVIILVIEVVYIVNFDDSSGGGGSARYFSDTLVIQAHNSIFDNYIDKTVKGKEIKELCAKIARYNEYADNNFLVDIIYKNNENTTDENAIVLVDGKEKNMMNINSIGEHIKLNSEYEVTGEMDPSTGLYTKVIVTKDDKKIQKNE